MAAPITASPIPGPQTASTDGPSPNYTPALASLTVLFFMMGFITCLNDILIPYLKAIFRLSYTQANFINLCFFGAYFVMGIPAGKLVQRIGYKGGMLTGFLVAALGAFLFYPAADSRSYPLFLGALFVLATGVVLLQVAGNPYVSILGPARSAPARLTLTQAFNSLGTTVAPLLGSALILKNLPTLDSAAASAAIDVRAVQLPYLGIGAVLVVISGLLAVLKLPVIAHAPTAEDPGRRAYHYRHLVYGVLGIFAYVGGEVAIGSHIVSYLGQADIMGLAPKVAGDKVAYYWGGAMVGRFLGAYLLNKFNPGRLLAFNAIGAVVLVLISISTTGEVAMWSLLAVGLMNSIMFATIFTLAVAGLGRHTEEASGLLNVGIVGGALVPMLFGLVADASSLRWAFVLPLLCYAYILWYGLRGHRPQQA
ncbi:MFS transporter, FHS family, L-fucose permease [Hymenobacter gelipurpurascens]|uniref:MFS transporter, FHS family, L-fucose permease n=1 Tax=Hymenobacter gelipurpurascens TaxID=89968 RepID=A0A212T6X4_9BACT|nr:sugar MFS transporter [Hymenobacter gelipurpurascens]SNC61544.1 MFS transporter, FHS family, L-fucose permease [Hymenobacter gelipurpurascens]